MTTDLTCGGISGRPAGRRNSSSSFGRTLMPRNLLQKTWIGMCRGCVLARIVHQAVQTTMKPCCGWKRWSPSLKFFRKLWGQEPSVNSRCYSQIVSNNGALVLTLSMWTKWRPWWGKPNPVSKTLRWRMRWSPCRSPCQRKFLSWPRRNPKRSWTELLQKCVELTLRQRTALGNARLGSQFAPFKSKSKWFKGMPSHIWLLEFRSSDLVQWW